MDIAVLSDIHGNYIALEKCVSYALDSGITRFIFLGDYLGELAYPQKTMKIIYSLSGTYECYFIKGNKEDYWINNDNIWIRNAPWKENDSTTGALYYTFHNLTKQDLAFFQTLPISKDIIFPGYPAITACHGSPRKTNEAMLPDDAKTLSIIENNDPDYILCGHTHIQNMIRHNGKTLFNPGAVGMPMHSKGKAQFLILKGKASLMEWDAEFASLDYDVEQVINDLHKSGLYEKAPGWCRVTEESLKTGEVSHGTVLNRAMSLCAQKEGSCKWPNIPEEYWQQVIGEIIG